MNGNSEEEKKRIITTLRSHPQGLTITEVANFTSMHRQTVAKYLLVLVAEDLVVKREIGPASLHYLKKNMGRLNG